MRREERLAAARELDQVEVVVAPVDQAIEEPPLPVAREIFETPDAAVLGRQLRSSRGDVVNVRVDRRSVPLVGAHGEHGAVVGPGSEAVCLLASIGQPLQTGAVGTDEVDLLFMLPPERA